MLILEQLYLYCQPAKWDHVLDSMTQCMCTSQLKIFLIKLDKRIENHSRKEPIKLWLILG